GVAAAPGSRLRPPRAGPGAGGPRMKPNPIHKSNKTPATHSAAPAPASPSPTLRLERIFNATPERLWSYWTDPKKYARWFNPSGLPLAIHAFDVRPGGNMRFDMPQPVGIT